MKYFFILSSLVLACSKLSASSEFIPEASAVTKVGSTIIIAGDEEPKSLWLMNDKSELTKTQVKGGEWNDLEGLAAIDDKSFYAMTSHGLTKKGKRKPEREKLLLISFEGSLSVKQSWTLRDSILKYLEKNLSAQVDVKKAATAVPDEGGLNIEGLAYHQGKIIIGLRSPLTKSGEAIVMILSASDPKILSHKVLDLEGKGIRSLESADQGLLAISGSASDAQEKFGLHTLNLESGKVSAKRASGFEKLLRPEGVTVRSGALILVQDFEAEENQDVIQELPLR